MIWRFFRIKAPQKKLIPVSVGSSQNLQVGQQVLAIGNPFGSRPHLNDGGGQRLGTIH